MQGLRVAAILSAALVGSLGALPALAQGGKILAVEKVAITVDDATKSIGFFRDVLGFAVISEETTTGSLWVPDAPELASETVRIVHLRLGTEKLDLVDWTTVASGPVPKDTHGNDLWFQHVAIVVRDMKTAYDKLQAAGVNGISDSPQTLPLTNPDAGGISAYYFRDPDGHALELIHFPPGKGDPRWQMPGPDLFQGIDHTAITVRDTKASQIYYGERLGLHVAGRSENSGVEQEKLSGVPGAHVRITGMRAPQGIGVEFLEYISPAGGRPRPEGLKPSDLLTWITLLGVPGIDPLQPLMRDPDGHLLRRSALPDPPKSLGKELPQAPSEEAPAEPAQPAS